MTIRSKLLELIEGEIERKKQNQPAEIMVKVNSLVDPPLIEALYRASQAGVRIRLNVRGACCLIPGVAGLSENIDVVSIIDRFLEHARILYFHHGGDPQLFISSADWMPRNLDRRLELMVPVESPKNSERLIDILKTYFRDNQKSHRLKKDGSYRRIRSKTKKQIRSQEILFREAIDDSIRVSQDSRTVFVPHLAEGESHF
jgi:polyphosphate kinase